MYCYIYIICVYIYEYCLYEPILTSSFGSSHSSVACSAIGSALEVVWRLSKNWTALTTFGWERSRIDNRETYIYIYTYVYIYIYIYNANVYLGADAIYTKEELSISHELEVINLTFIDVWVNTPLHLSMFDLSRPYVFRCDY